jgi:hypothetical protein
VTEEQWFAWDDPRFLLQSLSYQTNDSVRAPFSARRVRLFAVACALRARHHCTDPRITAAIDGAELLADARTNQDRDRYASARKSVWLNSAWLLTPQGRLSKGLLGKDAIQAGIESSWYAALLLGGGAIKAQHERIAQGPLLRDIVGNPFRPAILSPQWRTSTAVAIARGMYEARDFGAMPILADALQDAGCEDEAVLTHCRDPQQVHVRGCWVVDGVLGKA